MSKSYVVKINKLLSLISYELARLFCIIVILTSGL